MWHLPKACFPTKKGFIVKFIPGNMTYFLFPSHYSVILPFSLSAIQSIPLHNRFRYKTFFLPNFQLCLWIKIYQKIKQIHRKQGIRQTVKFWRIKHKKRMHMKNIISLWEFIFYNLFIPSTRLWNCSLTI